MKDITWLFYCAGDNNLSSYIYKDLMEVKKVGSNENINFVALYDSRGAEEGTRYIYLTKGDSLESDVIENWDELDSGDPETLVKFATKAINDFPSRKLFLSILNHGSGWEPSEVESYLVESNSKLDEADRRSFSNGRGFRWVTFRTTFFKIAQAPSEIRAIAGDDISGHSIDSIELEKAISKITTYADRKIDLLMFDACLMANLEVLYQLRIHVDFFVASEQLEPNSGWPYNTICKYLVDHPNISTKSFSRSIPEKYIESYSFNIPAGITLSVFSADKCINIANCLDNIATWLLSNWSEEIEMYLLFYMQRATRFPMNLYSLSHIFTLLSERINDNIFNSYVLELESNLRDFIIAKMVKGEKLSESCGVSLYISPIEGTSKYYKDLAIAHDFKWFDFLVTFRPVSGQ